MVWRSNFKHSSVRLEETIYIKYLYCKKSIQWNINTWRQLHVWYHGEHQMSILRAWCFTKSSKTRILRFAAFRPFYITSIYGLGKAANPPDISVVGVCDFTKFRIPPPLSFELKTMSRICPCPGAEKPIHPLVFPDIFPWLARGPTPGASRWHVHNNASCAEYTKPDHNEWEAKVVVQGRKKKQLGRISFPLNHVTT